MTSGLIRKRKMQRSGAGLVVGPYGDGVDVPIPFGAGHAGDVLFARWRELGAAVGGPSALDVAARRESHDGSVSQMSHMNGNCVNLLSAEVGIDDEHLSHGDVVGAAGSGERPRSTGLAP